MEFIEARVKAREAVIAKVGKWVGMLGFHVTAVLIGSYARGDFNLDRTTGQIEFRKGLVKLGRLLGFEIAKTFEVTRRTVVTPLNVEAEGVEIPDIDRVVLITVLRAAMPLTEGLLKVFPTARQGVVSARRVEETYR
jgi:hypothetical protein